MEDAVQALKMAFAVFVFVFALSVAFYVLSQARSTAEVVFYAADKTNYYDNVQSDSHITRIVGLETVIPTLYRYYRENFAVQIMDKDGKILQLFDTDVEGEVFAASKVIKNRRTNRQNVLMKLYGDNRRTSNNYNTYMFDAPWNGTTDEDAKARIDFYIKGEKGYINNALVDYTDRGLYTVNGGVIKLDTKFEETFIEYQFSGKYITEIDGEKLELGEELVDDMQGTKKIIITYKIHENN